MKFSDCCKKCSNEYSWKHQSFVDKNGNWCEQFCCMRKDINPLTQPEKVVKRVEYLKSLPDGKEKPLIFDRRYTDQERFLEHIDKFEPDYILPECPMQIELSLILFEKNQKNT